MPRPRLTIEDVARGLHQVLAGGAPTSPPPGDPRHGTSRDDLRRGFFDDPSPLWSRIHGELGTRAYRQLEELVARAKADRGVRLAAAFMVLVPGTGLAAVLNARGRALHRPDLSTAARAVLHEARALALGDDGARVVFDRLRARDGWWNFDDDFCRSFLSLPEPRKWRKARARGRWPKGLVFRAYPRPHTPRRRHAEPDAVRPIAETSLKRVLREAGFTTSPVEQIEDVYFTFRRDACPVRRATDPEPFEAWHEALTTAL